MSIWKNIKDSSKKLGKKILEHKTEIAMMAIGVAGGALAFTMGKKHHKDDMDYLEGLAEPTETKSYEEGDPTLGKDMVMKFFDESGEQYRNDILCTQLYADEMFDCLD